MRPLIVAAAFLGLLIPWSAGPQQKGQSGPHSKCGSQNQELPYFFEEAALEQIEPPSWKHSLIRIEVGRGNKLYLSTDGEKSKLWTASITLTDVNKSLLNLQQSCRLPAEPGAAAALINVKWESTDLTSAEFAEVHRNLTRALSQYAASAQERYISIVETKSGMIYLDATSFRVTYDNTYEHVVAEVVDDPKQNAPMLEWIHQLEQLAERSFHHSVWSLGNAGK